MRVVHCVWTGGRLHIWSEQLPTKESVATVLTSESSPAQPHPYAHSCEQLQGIIAGATLCEEISLREGVVDLLLPTCEGRPVPSPHIAHAAGLPADVPNAELAPWKTPTLSFAPIDAIAWLMEMDSAEGLKLSESTRFYTVIVRCARKLVAEQRFVPNLLEDLSGKLTAVWRPWLGDDETLSILSELVPSMPAAARAAQDGFANDAWFIVQDFLGAVTDALCREGLAREGMVDAIEGRLASNDAHVAWLSGLLDRASSVESDEAMRLKLVRGVRAWVSRLDERGLDSEWRLGLRLIEPDDDSSIPEFGAPGKDTRWGLSFELQSVEHPEISIDAQTLWDGPADAARIGGLHIESPHDLLLGELARAARLYPLIDRALGAPEPAELQLTTSQAYDFLREIRSLLIQQGFVVHVPTWWDAPSARLGVSLELLSGDQPRENDDMADRVPDAEGAETLAASTSSEHTRLGLEALVDYHWRLSLGDSALSTEQFEELTQLGSPLVRISGRWVELRPEDVLSARRFLKENPGGSTSLGSALRLAFGVDPEEAGLHIQGVHAQGWAASLFNDGEQELRLEPVTQPKAFVGLLRPYQVSGLAWMMFLDRVGLGACLADDMGLGKTIQLLALLLAEREGLTEAEVRSLGPTLVVAPLSVISNWRLEANRFAPSLRVKVHHGPERLVGEALAEQANLADMVITTYALAQRDSDSLTKIPWRRVALDEAQNIKNPSAKQTKSILNLSAPRRMALTGTPVENRLSELWSIMNFCNSGHLGTLGEFRRRFSVPIERRHSRARAEQLRSLTRPFILRRLKSDPAIAADLPDKIENKVFCHLTPEQAALYGRTVNGMLEQVDNAQGMQRRGVVLATLIKLKQICNHPAQALREPMDSDHAANSARSGKCARLIEMLDEVLSEDQNALIFTQFRQMGLLLSSILRRELDREILFLHGGTPEKARRKMIDRFQEADGSAPIFLLSLKAGGFGLNLTAASHVFHYDRWWNPAVENQATDRAHRIGQTRTVHVHKFVVAGTLEERIDHMIEEKSDLADRIINSGERGLTELSTSKLRELLTLRSDVYDSAPPAPSAKPVGVED